MMTKELEFSDVVLTPACLARWQEQVTRVATDVTAIGIEVKPSEPELRELDFGRLQLSLEVAPGFSVSMHAEVGEWSQVSRN